MEGFIFFLGFALGGAGGFLACWFAMHAIYPQLQREVLQQKIARYQKELPDMEAKLKTLAEEVKAASGQGQTVGRSRQAST